MINSVVSKNTPLADEGLHGAAPDLSTNSDTDIRRRERWSAARFGMFAHWGLSSLCGGWWNGQHVHGLAEWIQFKARIPMAEYRKLATEFNPVLFDAREWVRLAAEAGAKYFVFTAKHHDGFAMFGSTVSKYNIVDATPFGRDVLIEFADACREYGLMLGIYYSQVIDWEDADAVGPQCNDWNFDPKQGNFHRYWRRKAIPQLEELLSHYGEIGLMWFDMPKGIPQDCAREASNLIRRLQPNAVINSRLGGGGQADYQSMDDNYFNNNLPERYWETAATTNETWGYATNPGEWKPDAALCEAIAYSVSRGGNYLLNIGPDSNGRIPDRTVSQFQAIGKWMRRAAPSIHGASNSPFTGSFEWGLATVRQRSIYLHVTDPKLTYLSLPGLITKPISAVDLATGEKLFLTPLPGSTGWQLQLSLPTDALPGTVQLEFDRDPIVLPTTTQAPGESLRLDIWRATQFADGGFRWEFSLATAGRYRVILLSKQTFSANAPQWNGAGLKGRLLTAGSEQPFVIVDDGHEPYPIIHYWKLVRSNIGNLVAESTGEQWLEIRDLPVLDSKWGDGFLNVVGVRLEFEQGGTEVHA